MKSKSIATIKHDFIISGYFKTLIILFFGALGITTLRANASVLAIFIFFGLMMIAIAITLSRYYLLLDFEKGEIIKACRVLGIFIRYKRYEFNKVERMFLNKVKTTQRLASYIHQNEFRDEFFKAFIKFHDGEKIFLDSDHSQQTLRERLISYNKEIQTTIFDNYAGETLV